jgi:proteasome lid subunit RPN8/RPN11
VKDKKPSARNAAKDEVAAGPWKDEIEAAWRKFPGPPGASAELRVALSRRAFADVTAHGKESLEGEVCGVLAGELCEDDEGPFVDVQAAVRGTAARAGRGHVTFTQETWNGIHAALERDHPKLQIVGWYHTHPGFGVEFSEMDVFIQTNFFSLPSQVALVMDPLGGDVGLGTSGPGGLRYIDRFWVEGREHRARVPGPRGAGGGATTADLTALETRVGQLSASVQELRRSLQRAVFFSLAVFAMSMVTMVTYSIYRTFTAAYRPPEMLTYAPVPVRIEGRTALLGVAVVKWDVPEDLQALPPAPTAAVTPAPRSVNP